MDENIKKFKMQCNDIKNQYKDLGQIKELLQNSHVFNSDFEPLNYINAGSCGIVYEGKIKKNGRKIALKFLLNKLLESKRDQKNIQTQERERIARQKLSKEIKIQTKIKHKNITSLYGVYDIQNKGSCMILEYAKYGDLDYFQKKLIKKQTLSETLLVFIASQILTGDY